MHLYNNTFLAISRGEYPCQINIHFHFIKMWLALLFPLLLHLFCFKRFALHQKKQPQKKVTRDTSTAHCPYDSPSSQVNFTRTLQSTKSRATIQSRFWCSLWIYYWNWIIECVYIEERKKSFNLAKKKIQLLSKVYVF